jgi:hypothetical protein
MSGRLDNSLTDIPLWGEGGFGFGDPEVDHIDYFGGDCVLGDDGGAIPVPLAWGGEDEDDAPQPPGPRQPGGQGEEIGRVRVELSGGWAYPKVTVLPPRGKKDRATTNEILSFLFGKGVLQFFKYIFTFKGHQALCRFKADVKQRHDEHAVRQIMAGEIRGLIKEHIRKGTLKQFLQENGELVGDDDWT